MRYLVALISFSIISLSTANSLASDDARAPLMINWSFNGVTGTFDRAAAQRGFQVYKEVCSSCHSMDRLYYRNLTGIGFTNAEVKAIASEYTVTDGPDEFGDMYERSGRPSDRFVAPFPNEQAARSANGGALPPDLSLMIKAHPGGADYVYSILTGYGDTPEDLDMPTGMYYNPYFSGEQIAMAPPLFEGLVEYSDGTRSTVDHMARDVAQFLQWAAEPEMEKRKKMGIKVLFFLTIFTVLFYLAKKRIWARLK